jgi:hypothetical protein
MESRTFIKQANILIENIKDLRDRFAGSDTSEIRAKLQKDVIMLYSTGFNPHLPTAHNLFLAARAAGITVGPGIENQLARFSYNNFEG